MKATGTSCPVLFEVTEISGCCEECSHRDTGAGEVKMSEGQHS